MTSPSIENFPAPSPTFDVVPLAELMKVERPWSRGYAHHRFDGPAPGRLEFSALRLFAFESIDAGGGYDVHPHHNVEVLTLMLQGTGVHLDSLGAEVELGEETLATMSAGRGIHHAEHARDDTAVRLLQIWLEPRTRDTEPRSDHATFPRTERKNRFTILASGRACSPARLVIGQDAALYSAMVDRGATVSFDVEPGRLAYAISTHGTIEACGRRVQAGERILVRSAGRLELRAKDATEIVLLDLP